MSSFRYILVTLLKILVVISVSHYLICCGNNDWLWFDWKWESNGCL